MEYNHQIYTLVHESMGDISSFLFSLGKCRKFSLPLPLLLLLSQVLPSYTLCPKMSYSALYFHHSVVVPVSVLVEISEDKHETANNCIITRVEVIGTSDGNEVCFVVGGPFKAKN